MSYTNQQDQYIQQTPQPGAAPHQYAQSAPQQVQPQATHQEVNIPVVNPNTATFIADTEVLDIIGKVHPELASAMINLSIKKFTEEHDFIAYFIRPEFKKQAQQVQQENLKKSDIESPSDGDQPAASSGLDFGTW